MACKPLFAHTLAPGAPFISAMAVVALAAPAHADGGASTAPHVLDPVTVSASPVEGYKANQSSSAKYPVPLLDVPQTITVVPREIIQEQNAQSLRQVLSNVSGITFNAGEGGGGSGDMFSIRGFAATTNMQVDGLRDSAQTSRTDMFNLESVEVIKGPNSVYGGAGTTGGSVNMVSKEAREGSFTEVSAGLGTARYRRATLDANHELPGSDGFAAFRLNLMGHRSDVAGRDEIYRHRWGVAPSLTLGMTGPTRLTLSYIHQRDHNLPDYGLPALQGSRLDGVSQHAYFGWRNLDRENIDSDAITAKVVHTFNDKAKLQNLSRYSRVSRDTVISASHVNTRGLEPGRYRPAGPQAYGRDSVTDMWANQTTLSTEFDTFGLGHTMVSGFEFSRETYERDTYSYNIGRHFPAAGYDLSHPPGYWTGPTAKSYSGRNKTSLEVKALYLMDTIALARQWDLSLGLRYDWIDAALRSTTPAGDVTSVSGTDRKLSSRVGIVFKPAHNGRIYASYGTSFNPSAESLVTTGSGFTATTSDLDPEKNRAIEFGTKWDVLGGKLGLTAALFQIEKTNVRERMADGTQALVGRQRSRGLELGAAGAITPRWNVFANYTYTQAKTLSSSAYPEREGQRLGNTPRSSFSLWTTYKPVDTWTLGYGARFIGSRNVTGQGGGELPSYLVHSAMVSYDVDKHFRLQLNVDNLGNKAYVERVRQVLGSESRSSALEYGDGRAAMLTASYKF